MAQYPLRAENEGLRQEIVSLSARLTQAELIIEVQKKSHGFWGSYWRRPWKADAADGRHTVPVQADRYQAACHAFGLARSGFYRGQHPATVLAPRPSPPWTLSSEERHAVLETLHSDRFVDQAPATIYATLLDEGRYHCWGC